MRRLPEELALVFEHLRERDPDLAAPPGIGVAFQIGGPDLGEALIFIGLFPGAIPQRRPVDGTILTAPGVYRLAPVPDGRYHLMAAALPRSEDPSIHLLPGDALRVGRARGPLTVRGGRTNERVDVTLRPLEATDPPVLVSLPALLIERYAPDGPRQKQDRRSPGRTPHVPLARQHENGAERSNGDNQSQYGRDLR